MRSLTDPKKMRLLILLCCLLPLLSPAQTTTLLHPAAVFDGQVLHPGWVVLVEGQKITAAGPAAQVTAPAGARTLELPGLTLLPGLIEGHSHLLLHPYNETSWNEQVMNEPLALRVARATVHAQKTLLAGFTTTRDLGTEGPATPMWASSKPLTKVLFRVRACWWPRGRW
ncbi:hypothetical protein [Hymenobacter sp. BRD67]|uniref:hypothetical protein n=1 Tax=Hymenobacter sp. BRD67 TaxID=2675877 RepID=UPI00293BDB4F|nr:hypothetical protein [Hymenobacter sp. BRD67]